MKTGSNGKGSTCWKLAKTFMANGNRTGLFLSPHISCFRERIRVDDVLISENQVAEIMGDIFYRIEKAGIPATFFEVTTATMFQYFAAQKVDIAVIEVGLGGRLDSTNIIENPLLTMITNISLEHTRVLGTCLNGIAREKAGIAKPNSPMLIGAKVPLVEVSMVMKQRGAGALLQAAECPSDDFDEENNNFVRHANKILGLETCETALKSRPPCRFEMIQQEKNLLHILDIGHNHGALVRLFETYYANQGMIVEKLDQTADSPLYIVFALCSDKDFAKCVKLLAAQKPAHVFFTKAATDRAQEPTKLLAEFLTKENASVVESVHVALESVRQLASAEKAVVLVCGTAFMMTEARQYLKLQVPIDP